jgi:glucose/arabinose dehydrogenase
MRHHLDLSLVCRRLLCLALVLGLLASPAFAETIDVENDDISFRLELVADGFTSPVQLVSPPDSDRRFVVDQVGYVRELDSDGEVMDVYFLDLRDQIVEQREGFDERGLLGLAFHPDFADNGRFFVHYSAPLRGGALAAMNHTGVIAEFRLDDPDDTQTDLGSERIILEVDQPQFNHNGGRIAFGPDGYLYIALGDGGGRNDTGPMHPPMGNAQDVSTLLGAILRIDVDREEDGRAYAIPSDNPFYYDDDADLREHDEVDWSRDRARAEIWAWGLRNPYVFTFDRDEGDMWIADVGQNLWEEVNRTTEPGNFGWNLVEGTHGFDPDAPNEVLEPEFTEGPRGESFEWPIIEYRNVRQQPEGRGISVIGGYVYRGSEVSDLEGLYVFGDWSQSFGEPGGKIFVAGPDADPEVHSDEVGSDDMWGFLIDHQIGYFVLGFGEDADGELYVLVTENTGPTGETGRVYKIVPANGD